MALQRNPAKTQLLLSALIEDVSLKSISRGIEYLALIISIGFNIYQTTAAPALKSDLETFAIQNS